MAIKEELLSAAPRPEPAASRDQKKNYAERLSRALAWKYANALRKQFPTILPTAEGHQHESAARTAKGVKKLDVNYSTPELGLGLGVTIKTLNFRDAASKRYTKNYTRIDNELRAEAMDYHHRQPYSVLAGVLYLPADCCFDAKGGTAGQYSCFGAAVKQFRHRSNRQNPSNEEQLLERFFLGIYVPEGPNMGDDWYFDVMSRPPKWGRPVAADRLTFEQVIASILSAYDSRNNPPFEWAKHAE